MRKRKVTVPPPVTGEPFEVELETITRSDGRFNVETGDTGTETVTGYRFGRGFIEYDECDKKKKRRAQRKAAVSAREARNDIAAAVQQPLQEPGRMRLSALERLQRDAHAGNVAAVADYVRQRIDLLESQRDNLMAMVRERDAFIRTVLDRMDASAAGGAKGGRKSIKPPGADDLISRMVRDNHALGGRRRKSAQLLDQYIANALNDLRSNTNTHGQATTYVTRLQARDWRLALAKQGDAMSGVVKPRESRQRRTQTVV